MIKNIEDIRYEKDKNDVEKELTDYFSNKKKSIQLSELKLKILSNIRSNLYSLKQRNIIKSTLYEKGGITNTNVQFANEFIKGNTKQPSKLIPLCGIDDDEFDYQIRQIQMYDIETRMILDILQKL